MSVSPLIEQVVEHERLLAIHRRVVVAAPASRRACCRTGPSPARCPRARAGDTSRCRRRGNARVYVKSPPGAHRVLRQSRHAVEPIVEPHAVPVHGARQIDAVVKAHRDRRVLRHANERPGNLAVEAVHRERCPLIVRRTSSPVRSSVSPSLSRTICVGFAAGSVRRIDAAPGRNDATGGVESTSPGIIGMPFGIGIGIGIAMPSPSCRACRRRVARTRRLRRSASRLACRHPGMPASCRLLRGGLRLRDARWARRERDEHRAMRITAAFRETADAIRNDLQPSTRRRAVEHRRARVRRRRRDRLGRDDEQELVELDVPTVVLPFVTGAEPVPLLEIGRHRPGDVRLVGAERRRLGQSGRVDLHVVARAAVGRDGDAERRLREDQPRVALARRAPSAC